MSTDQTELLDPTPEQQIISSYGIAVEQLKADVERAKTLTVEGPEDTAGMKAARDMRLGFKRTRVVIESKRKELKADVLARGRMIDQAAKDLVGIFEDEEVRLKELEETAKREQDRIEQEKREAHDAEMKRRCDLLAAIGATIPIAELEAMDAARFEEVRAEKQQLHDARQKQIADEAEARRKESERLAEEKKQQEAREAEIRKKEQEIADREAETARKEREAEAQRIASRKEQLAAIGSDYDNAAMIAALNGEEWANFLNTERVRVETRKAEEAARLQREEKEAAARKAALAPDLEKLNAYVKAIEGVPMPELSVGAAACSVVLTSARETFLKTLDTIAEEMK